jgi:death on curing protein
MKEPVWLSLEEALVLHDMQLISFGGKSGVRDSGLLESALARPRNSFAYGKKPSLAGLAAGYAFGIVRRHPFVDGNKCTGLVVAFVFLALNGIEVIATEEDAYQVFIDLASGKLTEKTLTDWLAKNSKKQ